MNRLCRLCLNEIKEHGYLPIIDPNLLEQIFWFTSVQVNITDGKIDMLCRKCRCRLKASNDFRKKCLESNDWLLRIIEWQKHNMEYSRIPTETIVRILENQEKDDPLINPLLIKMQPLPPQPSKTRDAATSPDRIFNVGKRSIGLSTDDKITNFKPDMRDVGVGPRVVRGTRHIAIGTDDFTCLPKSGSRSIGVATSDWYWFHPKFKDASTVTENNAKSLAKSVKDNWTTTDDLVIYDESDDESESEGEIEYVEPFIDEDENYDVEINEKDVEEKSLEAELSELLVLPKTIDRIEEIALSANEEITCQFCSKVCNSYVSLRTHCQTTHEEQFRPFVCTVCSADFKLKEHLDIHNNVVHLELQHAECDLCGKIFFRKSELKTHIMMHLGERRYRCHLCPAKFSIKVGLNRHLALHKKTAEDESARKLAEKKSIMNLMQAQSWEKSYMCLYCGKNFATSESRNTHERNHSKTAINLDNILNCDILDILMEDDQMSNL